MSPKKIEIRYFNKKTGEMEYGKNDFCLIVETERYIPLESTGQVDIKGIEIYDGDIVVRISHSGGYKSKSKKPFVISWKEATHVVGWNIGTGRGLSPNLEVIGNIYQNLKLLK